MRVLYLHRLPLHIYPPCLSQILLLKKLNVDVVVGYGDCDEQVKNLLEDRGVVCETLNISRRKKGVLSKIQGYFEYRRRALAFLKKNYRAGDIIWFGSADSCFAIGNKLSHFRYVVSILELYDDNAFYRKNIEKVIHHAECVVVCEENRAAIMRSWWNLKCTPFVMPNKPYFHPREKKMRGSIDATKKMIALMQGDISILYQGMISADRDLGQLAKALSHMNIGINLYLMGRENDAAVEKLKKIYPNTFYLGAAPAPYHLEVTSHAYIGVANYDYSSLNNVFCAPNKIFEYCGFGIPVLANDVCGLKNTIGKSNAGVCVDFECLEKIEEGIVNIIENYSLYSQNATQFFDSIDNQETMKKIVSKLEKT